MKGWISFLGVGNFDTFSFWVYRGVQKRPRTHFGWIRTRNRERFRLLSDAWLLISRWMAEGFWDNKKDYRFTLTVPNVNSEIAEVKYESKDLHFSGKAEVIPGEKPKIEWMINSIVKPEGPFASPTAAGTKEYFAILSESIPIYYSFEIQRDGTLKGTFDSKRMSNLGTSRTAVMRRVNRGQITYQ
jgi:hypothetical protein